jgi:predicted ATP-grasp superfamily ATP-dependent carboligase
MKGFSLLVDTPGMNPDVNAARFALNTLCKFLNLQVDQTQLEETGTEIKRMLETFGLVKTISEEKKKEEQQLRWFI